MSTIGAGEVISYDDVVNEAPVSNVTVKAKSNAVVWFIPKEQLVKKDAPKEENVKLA